MSADAGVRLVSYSSFHWAYFMWYGLIIAVYELKNVAFFTLCYFHFILRQSFFLGEIFTGFLHLHFHEYVCIGVGIRFSYSFDRFRGLYNLLICAFALLFLFFEILRESCFRLG